MKLKEINRTATSAWGPHLSRTYLATGTMSGALSSAFSNTAELEIFELSRDAKVSIEEPWKPTAVVSSNTRFNRISWGAISEDKQDGIIAGGMESGELALWNVATILDNTNNEEALIMSNTSHKGSIRGLEFNPIQQELLATGANSGEVFIWNLQNPTKPDSLGHRSQRLHDITSLAWNNQIQRMMATSSTTGYTVVWDLKYHREAMHMSHAGLCEGTLSRGGISTVAWNPESATQLITASEDDDNPVIAVWDLRNVRVPEKILSGHSKGVLSLSWCKMDSDLLLSTGKDCRTLCWNPRTGSIIGELPLNASWTFDAQWCPRNPNLCSTASLDGTICLFSLESKRTPHKSQVQSTVMASAPVNNSYFTDSSNTPLQLAQAPKWLRPPVGASFSFGGKLVFFANNSTTASTPASVNPQTVFVSSVVTDPEVVQRSHELMMAFESSSQQDFCEAKASSAYDKEEADYWKILRILFESDARGRLLEHLGFKKDFAENISQPCANKDSSFDADGLDSLGIATDKELARETALNPKEKPAIGASERDGGAFFTHPIREGSIGPSTVDRVKPNPFRLPFQMNPAETTDVNRLITRTITLGDFASAVKLCFAHGKLSDALILAICGGGELLAHAQEVYFEKRKSTPYIRILHSVVSGDLTDIVENASLSEWDEVLAMICTYSSPVKFSSLCDKLGSRLEDESHKTTHHDGTNTLRHRAIICYLVSGNINKVLNLWIVPLIEAEATVHASQVFTRNQTLQAFIEKMTIFKKAIDYDESAASRCDMTMLYQRYLEYAEILISQGQSAAAVKYLNLIPTTADGGRSYEDEKLSIVKDRIYHSEMNTDPMVTPEFPFKLVDIVFANEPPCFRQKNSGSPDSPAFETSRYSSAPQSIQRYDNRLQTSSRLQEPDLYSTDSIFLSQPQQRLKTAPHHSSKLNPLDPLDRFNYIPKVRSETPDMHPVRQEKVPTCGDPLTDTLTASQPSPTPRLSPITSHSLRATSPNSDFITPPYIHSNGFHPRQASLAGPCFSPIIPHSNSQSVPNSYGPSIPSIATTASFLSHGVRNFGLISVVNPQLAGDQDPSPMVQYSSGFTPDKSASYPGASQCKYSPGDRCHVSLTSKSIYIRLNQELQYIRQATPAGQKRILEDVENRLGSLFDSLTMESMPSRVVERTLLLTDALEKRDFDTARQVCLDLGNTELAVVGQWIVGVKLLIELVQSYSVI